MADVPLKNEILGDELILLTKVKELVDLPRLLHLLLKRHLVEQVDFLALHVLEQAEHRLDPHIHELPHGIVHPCVL